MISFLFVGDSNANFKQFDVKKKVLVKDFGRVAVRIVSIDVVKNDWVVLGCSNPSSVLVYDI